MSWSIILVWFFQWIKNIKQFLAYEPSQKQLVGWIYLISHNLQTPVFGLQKERDYSLLVKWEIFSTIHLGWWWVKDICHWKFLHRTCSDVIYCHLTFRKIIELSIVAGCTLLGANEKFIFSRNNFCWRKKNMNILCVSNSTSMILLFLVFLGHWLVG